MPLSFSAEELAQLERRARRVSLTAKGEVDVSDQYLMFRRAQTRYAVAASDLRGVRPLPPLTRLPWCGPHLLGVANIEGHTLGALDLERLERPTAALPTSPWSLWVAVEKQSVLLVADEVLNVLDIARATLLHAVKGAFAGRLTALAHSIIQPPSQSAEGPLLVLESRLLMNPQLYQPVQR